MKVLIIVALFGMCYAQNTAKWTPFQCRDTGVYGPNDDRMAEIGQCKPANPNCVYFCHAEALGLLNADGLPTQEIYDRWTAESLPQEHKSLATAWFRDCFQKYGKFIEKSDKECKFAKLMGDCTWGVQPNLTCPKKA